MIWRWLHFSERPVTVKDASRFFESQSRCGPHYYNEDNHEWDLADQSNGASRAMLTSIWFGSEFEFIVDKY
jgi:hypothetical protein